MHRRLTICALVALALAAGLGFLLLRRSGVHVVASSTSIPTPAPAPLPEACLPAPAPANQAQAAPATPAEPSEAMSLALGQTKTPDVNEYQARLQAIKSLGAQLSAAEVEQLMDYLKNPSTARAGNLWDLGLKNEVLALLVRQERPPQGLGTLLSGVVQDAGQDLTWRDYALQFVPAVAARTKNRAEEENAAIRTAMATGIQAKGTALRGTALIAMQRLSDAGDIYQREDVAAVARGILNDSDAKDPSRITAIQMLASTGDAEGLAKARRIGRDEASPVLERMSVIGALGSVGTPEDLAWMRELAQRPGVDKRLKTAAEFNIEQLVQRMAKAGS